MKKQHLLSAGIALALGAGQAHGQSSSDYAALNRRLAELEKKTTHLEKENRDLSNSIIKDTGGTGGEKIKLSGPVTELALYGDLRLRYQYDDVDYQVRNNTPSPTEALRLNEHGDQRSRWRFRLRLNADFKLADNWFGGVQLQTQSQADSGFETYGNGFQNYNIYISRAYVGWNAADWLTLIGGKQPNPFYTTELVWDADINPSGATEQLKLHKLFGSSREEVAGYSKDGKAIVTSSSAESPWELTLLAGQFIYDDNQESAFLNDSNTDAYLFEEQIIASYKFSKNLKVTVAPAFLSFTAADTLGLAASNSKPFAAAGGTRDLQIVQLPGDVAFKVFGQKTKFIWDVAYNLNGAKRVRDIYGVNGLTPGVSNHSSQDDLAFFLGLQVGENKKKGDWSVFLNYRQIGLAAVDPNLNDSDWNQSRVNARGWKGGIAYNFTDSVLGALSYANADNLRKDLFGGQATGGAKLADLNSSQVFQIDLNVKF